MEYYGIPFETVELNPLWKRDMNNRIPVVEVDGEKMDDSSLIISVLRTCMLTGKTVQDVLLYYPEMAATEKGKSTTERVNKYFVMYNEAPDTLQLAMRREEREWREWVDSKLVVTVVPNMFRTLDESFQCFDYTREVKAFSSLEQVAVKYVGGIVMYCIGKYMRRRYQLSSDVRSDLHQCCQQWVCAVASHGRFLGGEDPCLADLEVYGVLRSLEGLDVFTDLMSSTQVGPWYMAMKEHCITTDVKA